MEEIPKYAKTVSDQIGQEFKALQLSGEIEENEVLVSFGLKALFPGGPGEEAYLIQHPLSTLTRPNSFFEGLTPHYRNIKRAKSPF